MSPTPSHGGSNSVALQSPVVQHIRAAANCRGGVGAGCVGQSTALCNEPHPLARLTTATATATAAAVDQDVDDTVTRAAEASHSASMHASPERRRCI